MAKLACDTGRGSQCRVWYSTNKGVTQKLNTSITINQAKRVPQNFPVGSWCAVMQHSLHGVEVVRGNVEHSPPFNAKAKTEWSYTAAPLICRNGVNRAMFFHHFLTDKYLDRF